MKDIGKTNVRIEYDNGDVQLIEDEINSGTEEKDEDNHKEPPLRKHW